MENGKLKCWEIRTGMLCGKLCFSHAALWDIQNNTVKGETWCKLEQRISVVLIWGKVVPQNKTCLFNFSTANTLELFNFAPYVPSRLRNLSPWWVNDCSTCTHSGKRETHSLSFVASAYPTHTMPPVFAAVLMTTACPAANFICVSDLHISQSPSEHGNCVTFWCSAWAKWTEMLADTCSYIAH